MKKTILIALAALSLICASSCQKDRDGVYNPKKKISKIFLSNEGTLDARGYMREQWKWDDNKLVSKAIYYGTGDTAGLYSYAYDGKRLSSITYKDFTERESKGYTSKTDFSYDGKKLVRADYYLDGHLRCTADFTHTGGKITEIKFTYPDNSEGTKGGFFDSDEMLNMIMPLDIQASDFCHQINAREKSISIIVKVKFTWDGNNIATMESDYEGTILTNVFTYDKKRNPFCGMSALWLNDLNAQGYNFGSTYKGFDRNNMLTCEYNNVTYNSTMSARCTYTYDGDYPITCIIDVISGAGYEARYDYEYLN